VLAPPMAKQPKSREKDDDAPPEPAAPAEEEPKEGQTTLKVGVSDAELVGKIAAHRGKSVAKLFKDEDVQDFLTHLLLEEMRKEAERLKRRKS
jgi:hypothetical protein